MKIQPDDIHNMLDWAQVRRFFKKYAAGTLTLEIGNDAKRVSIRWRFKSNQKRAQ